MKNLEFKATEPLKENRWIINTYPFKINYFLFRKYKMYNQGESIIFETSFFETIDEVINPKDLMEITDISIEYLDPIGNTVGGLKLLVKGINFEKKHSYKKDKLLTTKLRFVIEQIEPIYIKPDRIDKEDGKKSKRAS
jgi:hypothetical protein